MTGLAPFRFALRTEVRFGPGALDDLPDVLEALGARRALVVTDEGLVRAGAVEALAARLRGRVGHVVYDAVRPNPAASVIDAGERVRRDEACDVVVGFGGGSSIDTAKGIGILATSGGAIADYAGRDTVTVAPAPVVAVPTTAGTGAEVSTAIAVTDDVRQSKFAVRAALVPPLVAILDPDTLRSVPRTVAAHTGVDTLCHCIEAYVSRGASPLTDLLALEGVRRCARSLLPFVADRGDAAAGGDMLYAAMLGGIVISHARTGAAHTLTRPIGDKVPHGLANAIVLPHVMAYNLPADPPKFADVARALDRPADPQEAVEVVRELIATLELPTRLRDAGIDEADLAPLADAAYELEISGLNPRELGREDIERLLREAY